MKIRHSIKVLLPLVMASVMMFVTEQIGAAEPEAQQIAAITDSAKAFVEAFHKGDAKAVASFWTPDGDYVDAGPELHHRYSNDGVQRRNAG
jgi:ABC-type Na+ efflux pump permease subunit